MPESKPNCRRFQFGLRTMFVVVTFFAIWLGSELTFIHERKAWLRRNHVTDGHDWVTTSMNSTAIPMWRKWLGDVPVTSIMQYRKWTDAETAEMARLFPEAVYGVSYMEPLDP